MRPIKKGSTDQSVVIRIIDSTDGTPETGVDYDTAGIDLWYRREGATKTSITEAALGSLDAAHSDGGIEHIGDGYYRLDLPDAAVAAGADGVMVGGTVTDMIVIGTYVPLVDYDPYDSVRMGMTALPNAAADAAGGLPISDAGGLDLDAQIGTDIDNLVTRLGTPGDLGSGATVAANLADIESQTDDIGAAGAGLTAIPWNASWDAEVQSECADALNAYDPPTKAEMDSAFTEIKGATWDSLTDTLEHIRNKQTDIETDTQDLQTQIGTAGDGLTGVPWNAAWDAEVQSECTDALNAYDPPTKAELDTAESNIRGADSDTLKTISDQVDALNDLSAADVNAQVLDVLNTDTFAEPGQEAPPATTTLVKKIGYLYKFLRNKIVTDSSTIEVYNDAGDTVDHKSSISDDGTDFTRGEFGSGP